MKSQFVKAKCPGCNRSLKIPHGSKHKKVCCPHCERIFQIRLADSDTKVIERSASASLINAVPDSIQLPDASTEEAMLFETMDLGNVGVPQEPYWKLKRVNSAKTTPIVKPNLKPKQIATRHPGLHASKRKFVGIKKRAQAYRESMRGNGDMMSELDDQLNTIGVVLVLFGIALALFPLLSTQVRWLENIANVTPALGMIMGFIGVAMISFAHRRQGATSVAIAYIMVFLVTSGGVTAYLMQNGNWNFTSNDPSTDETREVQRNREDDELKIGSGAIATRDGIGKNQDDQELPDQPTTAPVREQPAQGHSNVEDPNSEYYLDPDNPFIVRRKPVSQPANSSNSNAPNSSVKTSSKGADSTPTPRRTFGVRTLSEIKSRWRDGIPVSAAESDSEFQNKYRLTLVAGERTNQGRIMIADQPIIGVDFTQQIRSSYLTPVYQNDVYLDQSIVMNDMPLAGLVLAFDGKHLAAVKGVFAPLQSRTRLSLTQKAKGKWVGDPTNRTLNSLMTDGPPVFGLVVFRREDQVYGVGLVSQTR